jgi:hypothetical protein
MKYPEVIAGSQHYIFIADESGVVETYREVKKRVVEKDNSHVSVIRFSKNEHDVLMKEMVILHNHFPDRFLAYYEAIQSLKPGIEPQEIIESVINENTREFIHFVVAGADSFLDLAQEYLCFLGINRSNISIIHTEK